MRKRAYRAKEKAVVVDEEAKTELTVRAEKLAAIANSRSIFHSPFVVMTYPVLLVTPDNVKQAKEEFANLGRMLICVPYKGDGRPEFRVIE